MRKSKNITDALRRQIIDEYLAGASKYSLMKKYGLSDARLIIVWLHKLGIENPEGRQQPVVINRCAKKRVALEEENRQLKKALAEEKAHMSVCICRIAAAERKYGITIS